jgi:hypothetical protein
LGWQLGWRSVTARDRKNLLSHSNGRCANSIGVSIAPAFLPSLVRSVKRGYADSAETVKEGIERVKEVDVDDYLKPLRKRWKQWVG